MNQRIRLSAPKPLLRFSQVLGFALLFLFLSSSCKKNCENVICYNGGGCAADTCHCPRPWSGPDCRQNICDTLICQNGGYCKADQGICVCPKGYQGVHCEGLWSDDFVGTFAGTGCDSVPALGNTWFIIPGGVPFQFILNTGSDTLFAEIERSKSFTIALQDWEGGEAEGDGLMDEDSIGTPLLILNLFIYPTPADTYYCYMEYLLE